MRAGGLMKGRTRGLERVLFNNTYLHGYSLRELASVNPAYFLPSKIACYQTRSSGQLIGIIWYLISILQMSLLYSGIQESPVKRTSDAKDAV
jgi:hypothetical protein